MHFEGFGIGSPIVFWILRLLLLGIFIYAGYGITYGKKEDFNRYAKTLGIFYTLIQGLRWMRGADYCHYYNDLVTVFGKYPGARGLGQVTPEPEILYDLWVSGLHSLGIPFWVAFLCYSALLIAGVLLVFKKFPKAAVWGLPFFFILTVASSENIIRQYFATAFVIFAYYFYVCDKKPMMLAMLIIAPLIHLSSIAVVLPFLLMVFIVTPRTAGLFTSTTVQWILVVIYIYAYWFFDISYLSAVSDFLLSNVDAGEDEKMMNYAVNADQWFTQEGSISEVVKGKAAAAPSKIKQMAMFLSFLAIVWFGFKVQRKDIKLILPYWFSYVAILFKVATGDIEIYARFYYLYVILMPVIFGYIFTGLGLKRDFKVILALIFCLYFLWYSFIPGLISQVMFGYGFIWDADVELI